MAQAAGTDVYGAAREGRLTRLAGPVAARARRRRYERFVKAVDLEPDDTILDVGCGELGLGAFNTVNPITGLDLEPQPLYVGGNRVRLVHGDAGQPLDFADGEFDVVFSNSLIEHLPRDRRPTFAAEVRRVGGRYFVQTPARSFPIEPHYLIPFLQFMPDWLARRLARFGAPHGPYEPIHLLGKRELMRLFPDGRILTEWFGPFPKSYMAVGPR